MKKINSKTELINVIESSDLVLCFITGKNFWGSFDLLRKANNMIAKYPLAKAVYIDIDESPELCADYSVFIAPTILIFTLGKEALRESKFIILDEIEKHIIRYINLIF